MPYEPIPDDELNETERLLMPAGRDPAATDKLLAALPGIAVYGFLLVPDPAHPLAAAIADSWSLLDHRSGPHVALVAFEPPRQWAAATVAAWRDRLGTDFAATWTDWQASYGLEPGAAYDYVDAFRTDPPLRNSDLPCLVLFCDPVERRAIVSPVPDWPAADLAQFLGSVVDTLVDHVGDPVAERLDNLAAELTAPGAVFRSRLGRLVHKALDWAKAHPAKIVTAVVDLALLLGTGNVLPLSATAVAVLKEAKSDLGT